MIVRLIFIFLLVFLNVPIALSDDSGSCSSDDNTTCYKKAVTIEIETLQPDFSIKISKLIFFSSKLDIYQSKLEVIIVTSLDEIPKEDIEKSKSKNSNIYIRVGAAIVESHDLKGNDSLYGGIGLDKDLMKYLYLQKYPDKNIEFGEFSRFKVEGIVKIYMVGEVKEYREHDMYQYSKSDHLVFELSEDVKNINDLVLYKKMLDQRAEYKKKMDEYKSTYEYKPRYEYHPTFKPHFGR